MHSKTRIGVLNALVAVRIEPCRNPRRADASTISANWSTSRPSSTTPCPNFGQGGIAAVNRQRPLKHPVWSLSRGTMLYDGVRGRQHQLLEAPRRLSSGAAHRVSPQCCKAQHKLGSASVQSPEPTVAPPEQLQQRAQALNWQPPPTRPSPVDGRRADSIIERTATHGNMSEAEVVSRLQVIKLLP